MKISFSPQLGAAPLAVSVTGDALMIDGTPYDFGPLAEGDVLPRDAVDCAWLTSDVVREGGHVCLALILPHGQSAPEFTRFPEPIIVTTDGPVALPPFEPPQPSEDMGA